MPDPRRCSRWPERAGLSELAREHVSFPAADLDGAGVDVYDTIREVHGHRKQGVAFGCSGGRSPNGLVATITTDVSAPVIGEFSLRRGNVRPGASRTGSSPAPSRPLRR